MRRLAFLVAAALGGAALTANAMPLGLRTAAWGVASANRRAADGAAFPALGASATADDVAAALGGAADERLSANIADAGSYAEFRDWANGAGAAAVKGSTTAWLSFAVASAGLVAQPKDGDLAIDGLSVGAGGRLEAVFSLDGVSVGASATEGRLKSVFAVEGAATPSPGSFAPADAGVSFAPTGDGRIKATVTPPRGAKDAYFLRIRLK